MRIMGIFFLSGPYIVQGEGMKKRREIYKRRKLPAGGIFFGGFLVGILLPNILWKMEWRQKTAASLYLIGAFAEKTASGHEYLAEVLKIRGSLYLLAAFCGISVFGVPLAVTGILLTGFQTGILLAMSVLEFGLQGGLIGAGLLFPQYLIYLPCIFYLMNQVYRQSMEIWHSRGLFPEKISEYAVRLFLCGIVYFAGILLEAYCNPVVVEVLMKSLKIF